MCKEPTLPKYARKANDETTNVDKGGFVVVAIDLSASKSLGCFRKPAGTDAVLFLLTKTKRVKGKRYASCSFSKKKNTATIKKKYSYQMSRHRLRDSLNRLFLCYL